MAKKDEVNKCGCNHKDPFVAIPASLGGIYLVIVLFVLIFAKVAPASILVPVAWAFVVLGFFAMMYAYKSGKECRK